MTDLGAVMGAFLAAFFGAWARTGEEPRARTHAARRGRMSFFMGGLVG
jgi:hypothetical protein